MKIIGGTCAYNEESLVPVVLPYIEAFGYDKFIVFDNGSTDRTVELLSKCPIVEVHQYDTGGQFNDIAKRDNQKMLYQYCLDIAKIGMNDEEQVWMTWTDFDEVMFLNSDVSIKRILEKSNLYGYNCFFKRMVNLFPPAEYKEGGIINALQSGSFIHSFKGIRASYWTGGGYKPLMFLVNSFPDILFFPGNHYALITADERNKDIVPFNSTCEFYAFHLKFIDKEITRKRCKNYIDRGLLKYKDTYERLDATYDGLYGCTFPLENYFMADGFFSENCLNGEYWEGIKILGG